MVPSSGVEPEGLVEPSTDAEARTMRRLLRRGSGTAGAAAAVVVAVVEVAARLLGPTRLRMGAREAQASVDIVGESFTPHTILLISDWECITHTRAG